MSVVQASLNFPIRKSSRRKIKEDKENAKPSRKPPMNRTCHDAAKKLDASPIKLVQKTDEKLVASLKNVVTPSKRNAKIVPNDEDSSPSKRRVDICCRSSSLTPLSPAKHLNRDSQQISVHVTAKRQLAMDSRSVAPALDSNKNQVVKEPLHRCRSSPRKNAGKSPLKYGVAPIESKSVSSSPRKNLLTCLNVSTPCKELYTQAKCALNTQQPEELLCRDKEIKEINSFLDQHTKAGKAGSLYISGAPGTGKTAVMRHLLDTKISAEVHKIFINSMTIKSPYSMYKAIATELLGSKTILPKSAKSVCTLLLRELISPGKMVLLVLDELDQLDSKHQEVLYTVFEWPSLANSRLLLIGIANALDLTDRILPRLNGRSKCKPQLLHFPTYTAAQIVTVLESRLKQTPEVGRQVLDKSAMMFCARKVSAVAGDMRKALDICRRSVEITQIAGRKEELLQVKAGLSPPTSNSGSKPITVGIVQVAKVVDEVYGATSSAAKPSTFPLQQKLVACTLLLMLKSSKLKEMTLGKVHDAYCRVCRKRDVAPTDQSEFVSLCQLLETRGLVAVKKAKDTRMMKISLKIDCKELEFALQDKLLISSVLQDGL